MPDAEQLEAVQDEVEELDPDEELGDIEAAEIPPAAPEAAYNEDPTYDAANDDADDEFFGEPDDEGTPGASGPEPEGVQA